MTHLAPECFTCLFFGPLLDGEHEHPMAPCPVIGIPMKGGNGGQTCGPDAVGAQVCMCECKSCKRPWEAMGRPLLKDGKIVFHVKTSATASVKGA